MEAGHLQVTVTPGQFILRHSEKLRRLCGFLVALRTQHRGNTSSGNDSNPQVLTSHAGDEDRLLR
jgi:hypothetical protein